MYVTSILTIHATFLERKVAKNFCAVQNVRWTFVLHRPERSIDQSAQGFKFLGGIL